jgi:two-component system, OmpR family, sensor kinase
LVGDLLFLARSEAEITAFAPVPVALQDVVAEAVEDGAALTGRSPEDFLDSDWPEEPVPVDADPQRLKQAILIAMENALKYGDAAAPVRVRVAVTEPGWAEVVIANTGPGLTPEELDRAFERFFRGRNARSSRAGGSGLGLSIARWIIERHGGTISLRSAPDGPTEVRLRLPVIADGLRHGEDTAGRG